MAAPSIAASTSNGTTASTTHAISLPAGIAAGDLLLVVVFVSSGSPFTWPAGWNVIFDLTRITAAWRVADGSEGASVSVTSTGANAGAGISYRITGANTVAGAEGVVAATATTSTPDPPALTPSWGSADVLWLAFAQRNNNTAITSFPTNYSLGQISQLNGNGNTLANGCARQLTASSEDPGTFSFSTSISSQTATIAVRNALPASLVFNPQPMLPFLVR